MNIEKIKSLSEKYKNKVIELRRTIHANPELSFQEYKTSELVKKELLSLGLEVKDNIAKTGVTAVLRGKGEGKTLLLRADMDALPLQEEAPVDYISKNPGVMHACGHDFHTANLLGVAMILNEMKDDFSGTVKFVFQPAEENGGGGRSMVNEGVLENPKVDAAMALHVMPELEGIVSLRYGASSAYSDGFTLKIHGKKAHTSKPQDGVDAILIAGHIIVALQSILTRNIDPFAISTFSLGKISGGSAPNIVPDYVEINGMMRNLDKTARQTLIENIEKISKSITESMGGSLEFLFKEGYPSVVNDTEMVDLVNNSAREYYSSIYPNENIDKFINLGTKPMLGAEDFGFFAQKVPSCFFIVGSGNYAPSHNSCFQINDEKITTTTLSVMVNSAINFLNK